MLVVSNSEIKVAETSSCFWVWDSDFFIRTKNNRINRTCKINLSMSEHPIFHLKAIDQNNILVFIKSHIRKLNVHGQNKDNLYSIPPMLMRIYGYINNPTLMLSIFCKDEYGNTIIKGWPYGNGYYIDSNGMFANVCMGSANVPRLRDWIHNIIKDTPEIETFKIDLLMYCFAVYSSFFDSEMNSDLRRVSTNDILMMG